MPDETQDQEQLAAEFAAEEVILRKDGTIVLRVAGTRMLLRRPKWKELRDFRETMRAMAVDERDQLAATRADLAAVDRPRAEIAARLDAEDLDPEERGRLSAQLDALDEAGPDGREAARTPIIDRMQAIRDKAIDDLLGWWVETALPLLARPVPRNLTAEDLPSWMAGPEFMADVTGHWSTVPRRPGVV